jgi:hypothetical protein
MYGTYNSGAKSWRKVLNCFKFLNTIFTVILAAPYVLIIGQKHEFVELTRCPNL